LVKYRKRANTPDLPVEVILCQRKMLFQINNFGFKNRFGLLMMFIRSSFSKVKIGFFDETKYIPT